MEKEQPAPEANNATAVAPSPEALAPETSPQPALEPAPAAPKDEPQRADPKDRHATLREAMIAKGVIKPRDQNETRIAEAGQRARDTKTGQFTKAAPQAGAQTPPPVAAPKPAAAAEVMPLPRSLKRELEAHWKTAHPDLQKAYAQRDADYERGIAQYRTQAEAANALMAEFKPYEQIMRMTGGTPQSALRSILPTMAVLTTGSPQEKAFVLARAMQNYGVPLEHIQQVMQGGAQAVPAQANPMLPLMQRLDRLEQRENAQRAAEDQRMSSIAESFGKDKPHFESLRPQMWSLLQAQASAEQQGIPGPLGSAADTLGWAESQWVENAYNAALRLNPALYESELQRQREEAARAERDRATQAAQASRAAAVQVRGAPAPVAGAASVDPRDRRSVIAAALRSRMN